MVNMQVRVVLRSVADTSEESDSSFRPSEKVVYFQLLRRLDAHRFLACIVNMYLSEYEDILLAIDTRAVSEIPVDWDDNINLAQYRAIKEGKGFAPTGWKAYEEAGQTAPLNYEGLF